MNGIDKFLEPAYELLEKIKTHALKTKEKMNLYEHRDNARELRQVFEDLEEWARSTGRTFH